MRNLKKLLNDCFKAPAVRKADPFSKSRPLAKKLAAEIGVEIEALKPGFNVWPPKIMEDADDPFSGDHYASDWDDVLEMVQAYYAGAATTTS